jgi:hypothetical protein
VRGYEVMLTAPFMWAALASLSSFKAAASSRL